MTESQQKAEFYVLIIAYKNEETIDKLGPFSEWKANKVDDGLNINLDHERYFTRVVQEPFPPEK